MRGPTPVRQRHRESCARGRKGPRRVIRIPLLGVQRHVARAYFARALIAGVLLLAPAVISVVGLATSASAGPAPAAATQIVSPRVQPASFTQAHTSGSSSSADTGRRVAGSPATGRYRIPERGGLRTYWALAEHYLHSGRQWPQIWRLNEGRRQADGSIMDSPQVLRRGWTVIVPAGGDSSGPSAAEHTVHVHAGDTLSGLAAADGLTDWHQAWVTNRGRAEPGGGRLTDPNVLEPGWTITLPGSVPTSNGPGNPRAPSVPTTHAPPAPTRPTPSHTAPGRPPVTLATPAPPRRAATKTGTSTSATTSSRSGIATVAEWATALSGGAGLVAASTLLVLRQLRRRRFRYLASGRVIAGPAGRHLPLEKVLVTDGFAGVRDVDFIDRTVRALTGNLATTGGRVPGSTVTRREPGSGRHPTATAAPPPVDADTSSARNRPRLGTTYVLLLVGISALAVRLFEIRRSYNIFVDEITYAGIGQNLATGRGLTAYGTPFDLHPPGTFVILAAAIRGLGLSHAAPDHLVLDLRPVLAVFGSGVVLLSVLVVRRCGAGLGYSIAVAAILGLDPFEILFDSRVMLESVTQFFVVGSFVALLSVIADRHTGLPPSSRAIWLGGLSAGAAFCCKETFGLVLFAALLAVALLPGLAARRPASRILGIGVACYLASTVTVWSTTGFAPWWSSKTSGFGRLIGTHQSTGFNASSTKVSLISRLGANAGDLAGTYLLLIGGGVAALVQLYSAQPWRVRYRSPSEMCRVVVSLWAISACGYLCYATAFGSIEEQMYYITLTPCVISLVLGLSQWARTRRSVAKQCWAALLAALLLFDSISWYRQHAYPSNLYQQFFAWERINIAPNSRISVTEDVGQFVLTDARVGPWFSISAIRAHDADYVLVNSSLVEQGYSGMTPHTLTLLRRSAPVVFSARSRQDGTLYLFDVRDLREN